MSNSNSDFLPQDYTVPSGNTNYMKLEKGENKFRIMSKPILGWLDWDNKTPVRFKMDNKPSAPIDPQKRVRHFWAMVVFNYKAEQIQILEITQASIQDAIKGLTNDSDWNAPYGYDLKIIKTGEGMDTEYQVNPVPHKPITAEMETAFHDKPVQLELLYTNEDPFTPKGKPAELQASQFAF